MHPDCAKRASLNLFPARCTILFVGVARFWLKGYWLAEESLAQTFRLSLNWSPMGTAHKSLATPLRSAARKDLAAQAQVRIDVEVPEGTEQWYEHHVAQEIGRIVSGIPEYDEDVQPLLKAVLSSILVKANLQRIRHQQPACSQSSSPRHHCHIVSPQP